MVVRDVESILDDEVDPVELARARKTYEDQKRRGEVAEATAFAYAHALIRSNRENIRQGAVLLENLLRGESAVEKSDYIYYLAMAHARLKEYDRSIAYLDVLLTSDPDNRQAKELKSAVNHRMKIDGFKGMAIVGGGLAVIGTLIAAAFVSRR